MKTKYKIYIAKIFSILLSVFFTSKKVKIQRNNIFWKLDLNQGIDLSIFIFGTFENSVTTIAKKIIRNRKIDIIDIGSNMGVHTLNLAKIFQQSKVYSIEPTNFAYKKLLSNLKLNEDIKNVYAFKYFITNNNKKPLKVYSSWQLSSDEKKHKKHMGILKNTINTKVKSLDKFISENKISRKTFIKCDVDGNELKVFKSGASYIKKFKPYIFMELAPYLYQEYGYKCETLINFLIELDYEFYDTKNLNKIKNIFSFIKNIKDGSSENIFLK